MLHLTGEEEIFTAKPVQLSGLLEGIRQHKTALPNFQRPWVWEPQMVGDLIFESALFYVAEERSGRRVRYDGLTPRYEVTKREDELAAGALPLGSIFDVNGYLAEWQKDYMLRRSEKDIDRFTALNAEW